MSTIEVSYGEFCRLERELLDALPTFQQDEASASLKCLSLACVGLLGSQEERCMATTAVERVEAALKARGLLVDRDLGAQDVFSLARVHDLQALGFES